MNNNTNRREADSINQKTEQRTSLFRRVFKPPKIQEWTQIWKERGFKGFVRAKGWKIVAAVFVFYLVRDTFLYIILPVMAARGLLGC